MARLSALSPRGVERELEDLATIRGLTAGQRVSRRRVRRRRLEGSRRLVVGVLSVVGAVVLAAGAGLGARFLLTSPRFEVSEVEVRGTSRLTPEDVIRASGIGRGDNLFRVDPAAARMGVETLAQVRRAEVVRSWPNRVAIVVEERRPFTLVHSGHLHWIDEDGVAMGAQSRAVSVSLPVISGLDAGDLSAEGRAPSARVSAGLALLRMLLRTGSPLTSQISEVDVSHHDGPVLYTVDGVEVRIGTEEWDARIPRLMGVLAQLASSGEAVSAIDLRFRDQVVLKPAVH
ncbi:MAG: FtsQ-type POTRA domain-containing protein [Candidatus Rokuibacteriota bacterium]